MGTVINNAPSFTNGSAPPWVYQEPANIVLSQIDAMTTRANLALAQAYDTIDALGQLDLGSENSAPPDLPFPGLPDNQIIQVDLPTQIDVGNVGTITIPELDTYGDIQAKLDAVIADLDAVPSFTPSVVNLVIPSPPPPINLSGMPDAPAIDDVQVPQAPDIVVPGMDSLLPITIPAFTMPVFPDFTDIEVDFEGSPVNTVMQWPEPAYASTNLTELQTTISAMLTGEFGMPPAVQDALFSMARGREDQVAAKAVDEAFTTWASRGFSMPPGMLVEQVNAAQQSNQLQANAQARDVLAKVGDWQIANLREAVTQGIALEGQLMNQFNNMVQRGFEASKARLDADIQFYQAEVALFNARQSARTASIEIFKAKIQAAVSKIDAYKTEVEAQQAIASVNESMVRAYAARIDALKTVVDIFRAKVDAAKTQSDIERNKIDIFRAKVDAYSAQLNAQKVAFDAYDSQVRGESAKAQIVEAEASAFASTVNAITSTNNAKVQAIRGTIDVLQASIQKFTATVTAERDMITAQATGIQARTQAFTADVGRYAAEMNVNTEQARLGVATTEARLRNQLAYYETRIKEYDAANNRLIERARIVESALSAAGQMASSLASGAMSAMHVQASISGSGNASTGWSNSYSYSESHQFQDESTSHE